MKLVLFPAIMTSRARIKAAIESKTGTTAEKRMAGRLAIVMATLELELDGRKRDVASES
jgi:hypothetical protein